MKLPILSDQVAGQAADESSSKGSYAFVSLGCPKNLVDSEKMLGTLALDGYTLVGDYEILANFSWGGLPYELVDQSMKLFTDKVMPHLKATKKAAAAAE